MPRAVIYGCAGEKLTAEEKIFFSAQQPVGFILFARNCNNPEQVKALVAELKATVSDPHVLVLIDQEGGRVARLRPPHWRAAPAAAELAAIATKDMVAAGEAVYWNARLMASELYELGINVDCAPLADVPVVGSHDIIGDRALGHEPLQVASLARELSRGLLDGGVLPVLKHIPGHGRARVDSHEALPVVDDALADLQQSDFIPFEKLADLPLGMTAHIIYTALDDKRVATVSPVVIDYIRNIIGFDGLLMSDDVSMKALSGDMSSLSRDILAAGCDLVLHCNGKMDEMLLVAEGVSELSPDAARRLKNAQALLTKPPTLDIEQASNNVKRLLSMAA